MWEGHDYKDPKASFGYGRTLVAIRPETGEIVWHHRDDDYIDSRGVCMKGSRIYFYCPQKHLSCLDAKNGQLVWRTNARDLLDAIGPHGRAQHYVTGYATTTYIKCNNDYIFFAGPQRSRLVVASAVDGRLLWQKENGNLQLVLREDGFYAAGPGQIGCKLAYGTGDILARLPSRRACTRATGSMDSVFFRTPGGTVRIRTASNTAAHIAPMRPPCQDGVIISDGLLYWGPWMCGCQLSLYGHICLAPAGDFDYHPTIDASRLERGDSSQIQMLETRTGDWPAYCGDSRRTCRTSVAVPDQVRQRWQIRLESGAVPTAPVTAGGLAFVGDTNGAVRAVDAASGDLRWQTYTGGAIYFPPAVWQGRVFVGSADGWVYALEGATGRLLWRFRCAPAERRIAVFGTLVSTWPVAGGVVVQDGTLYAAAGIAHYDGTYVYALDAVTGEVRWSNDRSGSLSEKMDCGLSLQGSLYLRNGELRFLGGGVYETARFDTRTGRCLNQPHDMPNAPFRTAFYPYYPAYGKYNSLDHTLDDGRALVYDASYEGSLHGPLSMLPAGAPRKQKPEARWSMLRRRTPAPESIWRDRSGRRFNGFAVSDRVVVAAGEQPRDGLLHPFIAAIDLQDGKDVWRMDLPATSVKGALALDHDGNVVVSMENGQLICLANE
jgi:outer membrane protein assembly factor BamB